VTPSAPTLPERQTGSGGIHAWLPLTLVVAASVAVYANSLANGLHVDDQYQIVTNPWIRSLRNLPTMFSSGVWDFDGRISSYYRPMMYVLYSLVYAVAGTAPWAYHLLNVVLHAGTAALTFLVARELLASWGTHHPWWRAPSFLVALLFAVHPVHAEPVAWAAGVVELSYSFFYLLAFYVVVRGRGRPGSTAMALGFYAAALLSKEPAITLPGLVLIYWALHEGRAIGIGGLARRMTPWVIVSAAYLLLRTWALGGVAPQTSTVDLSPWEYVLTASALLGRLLRAQVFPAELNFWHVFEPVRSFWSTQAVLALLTVGTWFGLFAWAVRRRTLVPVVALTLAVLPLTPALLLRSLNQGLENAFAERYVYLPSFGALLLAGWAVAALDRWRPQQARMATAAFAGLAVVGSVVAEQRSAVWKDSLSLWADAVAKSPESGVPNLYYGFALMSAGQAEAGRVYVQRAVALAPELLDREMRRAVSYAQRGRSTDAILAFHNILVMDPRSAEAHFNLGVLYEGGGTAGMAVSEYEAAIALDPTAADAHNNLGILYFQLGEPERAVAHLAEAVRLRPDDPAFRANLERARTR